MRRHHTIVFVLTAMIAPAAQASDVSWMFRPGYYTHSPVTGERVAQYEPERPSIIPTDPTYQESGYRHQVIQLDTDHLNIVQTWGAGTAIRPYGEWERPYRPGATPYGPWMNPYPYRALPTPYGPNRSPYGYGANPYGSNAYGPTPYGPGPDAANWQAGPQLAPAPPQEANSGAVPAPPTANPARPHGQEL
jgi:hypothetical protein